MTKLLGYLAAFTLLINNTGFAAVLVTEAGDKKIETVTLAKSGIASIEGQSIPLGTLGAGLRNKKVLFVNVKVYVAELFASEQSKFIRTEAEALKSLDSSRTIAVRLNFLRSVAADKVQVRCAPGVTCSRNRRS